MHHTLFSLAEIDTYVVLAPQLRQDYSKNLNPNIQSIYLFFFCSILGSHEVINYITRNLFYFHFKKCDINNNKSLYLINEYRFYCLYWFSIIL